MSVISPELQKSLDEQKGIVPEIASYNPTEEEKATRSMVLTHFQLGYTTMYRPRVEFNDLAVINRDQTDFLAWNTYQPNNGDPYQGDMVNGWRSNAIRPVERNKAVSIAAHATARLLFPKIFAFDEASDYQADAAKVLESLMEWTGEKYDYARVTLEAVIQCLVSPAAIVHTEYTEVWREVKREKGSDGKYRMEKILDETMSGFRDTVVRTDQFFIENFYETDIQKQGWLIWRRVQDHRLMKEKYGHLPNFQYVKPGMQVLYNDANQGFYYVYDTNMRQFDDEEILYWNKSLDVFLVLVNGILVTDYDNANPRFDKQYPFAKFFYEYITPTCFYGKSLVFKVSHDASIINTLYPMIIDGTYLNIMPPFLVQGGEMIGSDVIVPGQVTTLSSPDAQLNPIKVASDLQSGMNTLLKVEQSLNETSDIPVSQDTSKEQTAYETSVREQDRNTQLGLFTQMIASYVRQFGALRLNDILQHLTVAQADSITDNPGLVYKSFVMENKEKGTKTKRRKIKLDDTMPDKPTTPDAQLEESYKTLSEQGGMNAETELFRVNPRLLRNLKYMVIVSPDILNPRSEDVERMYMLETYDRAIMNPVADQEQLFKDFLMSTNPKSAKDPDKYVMKQQGQGGPQLPPGMGLNQMMPQQGGGSQNQATPPIHKLGTPSQKSRPGMPQPVGQNMGAPQPVAAPPGM